MTEASWSHYGGADCIRLTGLAGGALPQVRPGAAGTDLPPMAGLVSDGADLCFIPRFAFLEGTAYTVTVDGVIVATLNRPRPDRAATTEVTGIYPSSARVPRNLLRIYVWFSAPMSEGFAAEQVRFADDDGSTMEGALMPGEHELWDASRRRLTVLLDPARIKRGLVGHVAAGYPLRSGEPARLVVDSGFRDAQGLPLRAGAQRRYQVGGDERRHVDPRSWTLTAPRAGTLEPLRVGFERPLDYGLLGRCLLVTGHSELVDGVPQIGAEEKSWQLVPRQPWARDAYRLIVYPALEDVAGNSVSRVFDWDLARQEDHPRPSNPVTVRFYPR